MINGIREDHIDRAIEFLSNIPSNQWCTELPVDPRGRKDGEERLKELGDFPVKRLIETFMEVTGERLTDVNDGHSKRFTQKTPKARVLNAMRFFKKKVT